MYKKIYFLFGLMFFVAPVYCYADVVINEIMYDASGTDTNHEWIEVYNTGTTSIDLTGWKLFEDASNHGLSPLSGSTVSANGYAIIAENATQFKTEYPNVTAPIFDTTMSLSNTGETIVLKNASLEVVSQATYTSSMGATGNGNTLNRSGDTFVQSTATPGGVNSSEITPVTTETPISTEDKKADEVVITTISAEIIAPTSFFTNTEVAFTPKIMWTNGVVIPTGKLYWNFGDGTTTISELATPVRHTYKRAGKYVVLLEYSRNYYATEPEAADRLVVSASLAPLSFERKVASVVIKNTSNGEVDLSEWAVVSPENIFIFPHGTILLGGTDIEIPFTAGSSSQITFQYPNSTVFSVIPPVVPAIISQKRTTQKMVATPLVSLQPAISQGVLTASVALADNGTSVDDKPQSSKLPYAILGFVLLIVTATTLVIKMRRSKKTEDGSLTAEDIEIIESEE